MSLCEWELLFLSPYFVFECELVGVGCCCQWLLSLCEMGAFIAAVALRDGAFRMGTSAGVRASTRARVSVAFRMGASIAFRMGASTGVGASVAFANGSFRRFCEWGLLSLFANGSFCRFLQMGASTGVGASVAFLSLCEWKPLPEWGLLSLLRVGASVKWSRWSCCCCRDGAAAVVVRDEGSAVEL